MNTGTDTSPSQDHTGPTPSSWWIAMLGHTLHWALLRDRESGTAEVLNHDGNLHAYDSIDTARAALMDAEFSAFDGLDEGDALERGFALGEITPPHAQDDDTLRPQMIQSLGARA